MKKKPAKRKAAPRRRKTERGLHYYAFAETPQAVLDELREVADSAELPVRVALKHLVRHYDLVALVRAGLDRAAEHSGKPTGRLGIHLPRSEKARVVNAANTVGIQIGHVGRLMLIALAGTLGEAVRSAQWSHLREPAPPSKVVSA